MKHNNLTFLITLFIIAILCHPTVCANEERMDIEICNTCTHVEMQMKAVQVSAGLRGSKLIHVINPSNGSATAYRIIAANEPGFSQIEVIEVAPHTFVTEVAQETKSLLDSMEESLERHPEVVQSAKALFDFATFSNYGVVPIERVDSPLGMKIGEHQHLNSLPELGAWSPDTSIVVKRVLLRLGVFQIAVYPDKSIVIFQGKVSVIEWEPVMIVSPDGKIEYDGTTNESSSGSSGGSAGYNTGGGGITIFQIDTGDGWCTVQHGYPPECDTE